MRLLDHRFASIKAEGRLAFMPFLVVGDPNPDGFLQWAEALIDAGADALELGFPYTDPPADGPVVQAADQRALKAGVSTQRALELVTELRRRKPNTPVSLLIYYNLVLQRGLHRFYQDARDAGIDAVLVADVPVALHQPLVKAARENGVAPVFLASRVTTLDRAKAMAPWAESYIYAAARVGVTGERNTVSDSDLARTAACVREAGIDLPLVAGFGLSTPDHFRAVKAAGVDGAIVGSALIRAAAEALPDEARAASILREMAQSLRGACDSPGARLG